MKHHFLSAILSSLLYLTTIFFFSIKVEAQTSPLDGAWQLQQGSTSHILVFQDGYFTYTSFRRGSKEFISSIGGTYQVKNNQMVAKMEFNSSQTNRAGDTSTAPFLRTGKKLRLDFNGKPVELENIDEGTGPLAGTWRITGRVQEGIAHSMADGPRKTLKILSGSRFQWFAINPEAKQFSGTGGGTYTFKDGKYTETIEFFSRDSSRVGLSLSFEDKVENNNWHHTGKSTKGDPIHEIWSRYNESPRILKTL